MSPEPAGTLIAVPTLFLMCGLPGSGKTTAAKRLEAEHNALRLSPDEWVARIVGTGYDEAKRAEIEAVQWEIAQRALGLGLSVILESGSGRGRSDASFVREPQSWARTRS